MRMPFVHVAACIALCVTASRPAAAQETIDSASVSGRVVSGTNTTRGDLYFYLRDDAFNAANALSHTTLPMHQDQYGGSLGGPLARNRTFYFANAEQKRLDQSGLTTIAPASVEAINARLAAAGYPGASVSAGVFANPVNTSNVLVKVDRKSVV